MVDIVHSSSRDILVRKIGYSVGLEDTRSRILRLVDLYSSEHQLRDTTWTELVRDRYNRSAKSKVHFENFFNVIGVLKREQGRLVALQTLEALTILKALFSNDPELFSAAVDPVLLVSLTIADGELLANLMVAQFDSKHFESQLTAYRESKLSYFYESYKNENDRRELHRCIDFKEMPKAGLRNREKQGPFADIRQFEIEDPYDFDVKLSDDWYTKVPGHRKNWARDLGLWSDRGLTSRGDAYLELLVNFMPTGVANKQPIILMPTDLEFSANYLTWALELGDLIHFDSLITGLGKVFAGEPSTTLQMSDVELVDLVHESKEIYSASDIRFARIRKELPLTVFARVLLGLAAAKGHACPSPLKIVEKFQKGNFGVLVRKSRNSLFAFSVTTR